MRIARVRRRVTRRTALILLVLVVAGALLWAQNSTVLAPDMQYTVVAPRTLTLHVAVASCSWTRVTGVTETADAVRIRVETLPCPIPGPQTASLEFRDLAVSLAADLGTRHVEDANGQPISPRDR